MKVGSLVECVDATPSFRMKEGIVKPLVLGEIYTVRGFIDGDSLWLEEIINELHPCGDEYCYYQKRFREIQPPMDISELIEECQTVSIEL